jgi:PAS domain S-box-containing protein
MVPDASTWRLTPDVRYHKDLALAAGLVAASVASLLVFGLFPGLQFTLLPPWGVALHTLFETSSVVLSVLIFAAGLYGFTRERSSNVALMCNVFLAVAILDFVHILSFDGMPDLITPSGNGKSLSFLLAARLLVAVAMLAIAVLPWQRQISRAARVALLALSLAFALAVSAYGLYAPELAGLFFQAGSGLTVITVALEYGVVLLNLAAAAAFYLRMRAPQPYPLGPFFAAACLMALSEFCLTLYSGASDQYALMAHVLRLAAYVFVYRATFVEMLDAPYRHLERARAELVENEEKYRLLFENSLDAYLIANPDGSFQTANPAASTMFGVALEDLWRIGRDDVTHDPALAQLLEQRDRQGFARRELVMRRADGSSFVAEVCSSAYCDSHGRKMSSTVVRDITEKRKVEEDMRALNASLESRVRERTAALEEANQDLERFSHVMAHDLRSPLVAIEGFAGLLQSSSANVLGDKQKHYLDKIRNSAGRMAEMIDALLELADVSRSSLKVEDLDLSGIVDGVLASCMSIEPDRQLTTRVQPAMALQGDRRLLTLVMAHLIGSAWKHTARNAGAEISIGAEPGGDGSTVYFVRDNGPGWDPALAAKVMDRFGGPTGAGGFAPAEAVITSVRRIMVRHGGRVWGESVPGGGAVVRFTLRDRAV